MTGISRGHWSRASWLCLAAACGGRAGKGADATGPAAVRVVQVSTAMVLETAGPPPPDTSVTFTTGRPRVIVLRYGAPENVVFAELAFPPGAFRADSGREVRVDVRPRPGVYGLDLSTSLPLAGGATVTFKYARYFSAPARARAAYGSDGAYERALAVGELLPNGTQLALLPSTRPAADNLRSALPAPGTYLVAAAR
jgi:hypothetical protein